MTLCILKVVVVKYDGDLTSTPAERASISLSSSESFYTAHVLQELINNMISLNVQTQQLTFITVSGNF